MNSKKNPPKFENDLKWPTFSEQHLKANIIFRKRRSADIIINEETKLKQILLSHISPNIYNLKVTKKGIKPDLLSLFKGSIRKQ